MRDSGEGVSSRARARAISAQGKRRGIPVRASIDGNRSDVKASLVACGSTSLATALSSKTAAISRAGTIRGEDTRKV